MIYKCRLKGNKYLGYNTEGFYHCPNTIKTKEKGVDNNPNYFNELKGHSRDQEIGWYFSKTLEDTSEETKDGVIRTTKILRYKITEKHPPTCECGKEMILRFAVWHKYVDPKAEVIGGMVRLAQKDKTYFTKYLGSRDIQKKFVKDFLKENN